MRLLALPAGIDEHSHAASCGSSSIRLSIALMPHTPHTQPPAIADRLDFFGWLDVGELLPGC